MKEAIILAGGESWRLKPDIWIPKPMLKMNSGTLLEHQIAWLKRNGFDHIIIASDQQYQINELLSDNITWSIEKQRRGTGGAVLLASDYMKTKYVYVMNVDDLLLGFNPNMLLIPEAEAKILVSKPRLGFGRVELRQDLVLNFKEKPILDFYVSCGHYCFKKHIIDKYFPDIGNIEETVLPRLAKERILKAERYHGIWITINTMKDYLQAKQYLETLNSSKTV